MFFRGKEVYSNFMVRVVFRMRRVGGLREMLGDYSLGGVGFFVYVFVFYFVFW